MSLSFTIYADQLKQVTPQQKGIFIHIPRTGGTTVYKHTGSVAPRMVWRHGSANAVREYLNGEWEQMFTFAFVRNPWDRLASWYIRSKEFANYKEDYEKVLKGGLFVVDNFHSEDLFVGSNPISQKNFITDSDGKVLVDFVGKLENFDNDFKYVCDRLGIKNYGWGKHNCRNYAYKTLYNDELVDLVAKYCDWEIKEFGYKYN